MNVIGRYRLGLSAVADIVITGSGIDASLIADVLAICYQHPDQSIMVPDERA
jgi:hypothetical protein